MKILKVLGIVLLSVLIIVVVLSFIAPKGFKMEKSIVISSTNKEVIFKNISSWSDFLKWNPWAAKDPKQKLTFKGEEGTIGSSYTWDGNDSVGKGEMILTSFIPYEKVEMDLNFIKPFKTKNKTIFNMVPEGQGYKVTWIMSGESPFPFNILHLFMDMEKMIGPDFEKGLNNLKEKVLIESIEKPKIEQPSIPSDSTKMAS